jgi:hypothetical protein
MKNCIKQYLYGHNLYMHICSYETYHWYLTLHKTLQNLCNQLVLCYENDNVSYYCDSIIVGIVGVGLMLIMWLELLNLVVWLN